MVEVAATYTLTDDDRRIVEHTTAKVPEEARAGIQNIHREQLRANRKKRARLVEQLEGLDRAILLREASLDRLGAVWAHADGTACVAGHDPITRQCAEGGGPVHEVDDT